ncbi:hypothetical protein AA0113_g5551 [Alternaria arborescens]|uniref:Uncharacterized protein n=1 Tax=Alternaria arborescens TaxID=156630 RepID=A0A4Q4S5B6_9PLEO|nr:hypothetical protein AA0111_g1889 [Alternaria arborescens]RYN43833.1 hypothetical protein AA0112_g450 [Alternaria arborescens]RYO39104.1 hypothetical protein AA0111_g1889 [Alternaria arborescens]RYO64952.1 hypothetical protein AA0113_g5551 [Alternaria arborescens]
MVRRTDPKDDEWRNVRDAKKRKQIQDRLAQRARRMAAITTSSAGYQTVSSATAPRPIPNISKGPCNTGGPN